MSCSPVGDYKTESVVFDLLGIGFGPANLAISVVLAEDNLARAADGLEGMRACFVESHAEFCWHPGMMIAGSRMQISFLKDLATIRNPSSPFTFLNYLHAHQRLVSFINRAAFTPTRVEFADYLSWVARQIASLSQPCIDGSRASKNLPTAIDVCYGERVVAVEAIRGPSLDVELLQVTSISNSDGSRHDRLCRNLIVSTGGTARIPDVFQHHRDAGLLGAARVIHTSTFLQDVDQILARIVAATGRVKPATRLAQPLSERSLSRSNSSISLISSPSSDGLASALVPVSHDTSEDPQPGFPPQVKIAVIGGGQSATETLLETYWRLKASLAQVDQVGARPEIELIIRRGHLRPSDDSPFSNEVFNPEATDFFYNLPDEYAHREKRNDAREERTTCRERVLAEAGSTNYAVVNPETLSMLYETMYAQKVEHDITSRDGLGRGESSRAGVPKITITRYTQVVRVEDQLGEDGMLGVELENVLTGKRSRSKYSAIILGTGYSRQGWREMLFGPSAPLASGGMRLAELWPAPAQLLDSLVEPLVDASPTNSIISSPPSEEAEQRRGQLLPDAGTPALFGVARNYRLMLPKTFVDRTSGGVKKFRPTVWLQGCNEATHGISDSLLSVVSVRAGEVLSGIKDEGWFGISKDDDY